MIPDSAIVSRVEAPTADERRIIDAALACMETSNWKIGQYAFEWVTLTGKSDAEFGERIELSKQSVQSRRSVYERFGDSTELNELRSELTWSHFRAAVSWPDAIECLRWAFEADANVREMTAWRRAKNGQFFADEPIEKDPSASEQESESEPDPDTEDEESAPFEDADSDGAELPDMATASGHDSDSDSEYTPFSGKPRSKTRAASDDSVQLPDLTDVRTDNLIVEMLRRIELKRLIDLLETAYTDREALLSCLTAAIDRIRSKA